MSSDDLVMQVRLETLLELPLPAAALATVWREAMTWSGDDRPRRRLALELAVLEPDRCRELGQSQGLTAGLPRPHGGGGHLHNLGSHA